MMGPWKSVYAHVGVDPSIPLMVDQRSTMFRQVISDTCGHLSSRPWSRVCCPAHEEKSARASFGADQRLRHDLLLAAPFDGRGAGSCLRGGPRVQRLEPPPR